MFYFDIGEMHLGFWFFESGVSLLVLATSHSPTIGTPVPLTEGGSFANSGESGCYCFDLEKFLDRGRDKTWGSFFSPMMCVGDAKTSSLFWLGWCSCLGGGRGSKLQTPRNHNFSILPDIIMSLCCLPCPSPRPIGNGRGRIFNSLVLEVGGVPGWLCPCYV